MMPQANWVLISTPGKWAGDVAGEALDQGLNVFLYSDNVSLEDELSLKSRAATADRLVLGPDCGTTLIHGVGFGFANRVRTGPIGVVAASGTGIQAITSRVHELGSGISHALGTGGRDLTAGVAGSTASRALELLARDSQTEVIVLASKPPEPTVVCRILSLALGLDKPVVVQFSGLPAPAAKVRNLYFARSLSEAADLAVELATDRPNYDVAPQGSARGGYLRGLFAGGTLALEALQGFGFFLTPLFSNLYSSIAQPLESPIETEGHTIVDLGADEYTVGRLHPMMDQQLRIQLLEKLGRQRDAQVVLMDVVLGAGAHPDPAGELAPVIRSTREGSKTEFVVVMIGTDADPQGLDETSLLLREAGARVVSTVSEAIEIVVALLAPSNPRLDAPADLDNLDRPQAINVGLESFFDDLVEQQVSAVQVDWRPPAGGDDQIISILKRMRS
jgi:FdrA protein